MPAPRDLVADWLWDAEGKGSVVRILCFWCVELGRGLEVGPKQAPQPGRPYAVRAAMLG